MNSCVANKAGLGIRSYALDISICSLFSWISSRLSVWLANSSSLLCNSSFREILIWLALLAIMAIDSYKLPVLALISVRFFVSTTLVVFALTCLLNLLIGSFYKFNVVLNGGHVFLNGRFQPAIGKTIDEFVTLCNGNLKPVFLFLFHALEGELIIGLYDQ